MRPIKKLFAYCEGITKTVPGGQFKWGTCLLKSNGGVHQGRLAPDGNRSDSVKAKAGFTARRMCRAVAKAGLSEPTLTRRSGEDHQLKATPGITGWYRSSVHSDGGVRHLNISGCYRRDSVPGTRPSWRAKNLAYNGGFGLSFMIKLI